MEGSTIAGLVAGAIAVTAGGSVTIIAEDWPQAVLVALAIGAVFGLGTWSADRRITAVVAVVRSFCKEVSAYYAARADGEITDAETASSPAASAGSSRTSRPWPSSSTGGRERHEPGGHRCPARAAAGS